MKTLEIKQNTPLFFSINEIEKKNIRVNYSNKFINIPIEKIIRLEADCNYTNVFTETQKFICARTIGLYEELLDKKCFIRVHKKHIVNIRHIERIEVQNSCGEIRMEGGKNVEVSRRKLKDVVKKIETYQY